MEYLQLVWVFLGCFFFFLTLFGTMLEHHSTHPLPVHPWAVAKDIIFKTVFQKIYCYCSLHKSNLKRQRSLCVNTNSPLNKLLKSSELQPFWFSPERLVEPCCDEFMTHLAHIYWTSRKEKDPSKQESHVSNIQLFAFHCTKRDVSFLCLSFLSYHWLHCPDY